MPQAPYDVAVIGAGPAGSSTAAELAKRGFRVALLEEHAQPGVPQHCAGMLTKKACRFLRIHVPREVVQAEPARICLRYGSLTLEARFELYIVNRSLLDQYLAERAVERGAELITRFKVVSMARKEGLWRLKARDGRELTAKLVVGADGYKARSVRLVGLSRPKEAASCLQYELELPGEVDTGLVACYFGSEVAPGGYAWVVPIGERSLRVGLGVRKPGARHPAKHYLDRLVRELFPGARVMRRLAGLVSVGGPMRPSYADAFLAVGEAAGQVNPITGAGCASAIACGRIAGRVAAGALEEGDLSAGRLAEYERRWWDLLGLSYQLALRLRALLEAMSRQQLIKLARASSWALSSGHAGLAVLWALAARPELLKLLPYWRRLKLLPYF